MASDWRDVISRWNEGRERRRPMREAEAEAKTKAKAESMCQGQEWGWDRERRKDKNSEELVAGKNIKTQHRTIHPVLSSSVQEGGGDNVSFQTLISWNGRGKAVTL